MFSYYLFAPMLLHFPSPYLTIICIRSKCLNYSIFSHSNSNCFLNLRISEIVQLFCPFVSQPYLLSKCFHLHLFISVSPSALAIFRTLFATFQDTPFVPLKILSICFSLYPLLQPSSFLFLLYIISHKIHTIFSI